MPIPDSQTTNRRMISLDILRVAAFAVIIVYHFFAELYRAGKFSYDITAFLEGRHMNAVMTAVTLFFLISGMGLSLSADRRKEPGWRSWYRNHLIRLFSFTEI